MSDPILHIKDSYYFEVPKVLAPSSFRGRADFPEVWVSLDPQFQSWEAARLYSALAEAKLHNSTPALQLPEQKTTTDSWLAWRDHDHANFGKPFDGFLDVQYERLLASHATWKAAQLAEAKKTHPDQPAPAPETVSLKTYLGTDAVKDDPYASFAAFRDSVEGRKTFEQLKLSAGSVKEYQQDAAAPEWSSEKIASYNGHLAGKILIPQPFGKLRNLYEADAGLCVSRFMIIQLVVAVLMCLIFGWLGRRVVSGKAPKGKLWNLLEVFVVYIRDHVAEPAIGHHDAHRFVPLLWTIFFFVLGCNLSGMLPWVGAPTGSFGVTLGMACVTLATVVVSGMMRFGFIGFFKNQVPGMDLPIYMAVFIKPLVFAIEMLGLCIKHAVLAVRLLANMVAGHLVLLGVMGLAFGAEAAFSFTRLDVPSWQWPVAATMSVLGCTAFSLLELGVALLQAYIFTFLSALFIGASVHHH